MHNGTGENGKASSSPNAASASSVHAAPMRRTGTARLRALADRHLPQLLLLPDLAILYVAFIGGLKVHFGAWTLPGEAGHTVPLLLTLIAYPAVLAAVGLYRMRPHDMHLPQFLCVGAGILGAWAGTVMLMYLVHCQHLPPRSVTAVHGLLSIVGILGLRALVRQAMAWNSSVSGAHASPREPLQMHDLLSRDAPVEEVDTPALRDYLTGRTVLVTGAGGSIGTELAQQLLRLGPFRLVLVDVSEYNLFQLENALRTQPFGGELEFRLADVRNRSIMDGLFSDFRPDVVLHTAAYKHVPLMERHPAEAFRNNTLSTVTLLELSQQHDAEQFIFVSTDKAVEPASVLGATKRLAEWYVRSSGARHNGSAPEGHLKCKTVRFGNVFGSQGSVVPRFEKQLRNGGPVRVTHPDMERYFMSAHEACSLILQTLLMDSAPVYVFDMGEPVSIQWLAEQVVQRIRPGTDLQQHIVHTGVRPGEKLRETLRAPGETARPTDHDRITGLDGPALHTRAALDAHLQQLSELCAERRNAAFRKALFVEDFAEDFSEAPAAPVLAAEKAEP